MTELAAPAGDPAEDKHLEAFLAECVHEALNNYMLADAIFLGERLYAACPTEARPRHLLARLRRGSSDAAIEPPPRPLNPLLLLLRRAYPKPNLKPSPPPPSLPSLRRRTRICSRRATTATTRRSARIPS